MFEFVDSLKAQMDVGTRDSRRGCEAIPGTARGETHDHGAGRGAGSPR
jgi:hypothetical protein